MVQVRNLGFVSKVGNDIGQTLISAVSLECMSISAHKRVPHAYAYIYTLEHKYTYAK